MSHVLEVSSQLTIAALLAKGWSKRRIARELGLHRKTVSRYCEPPAAVAPHCLTAVPSKCTTPDPKVTAGSVGDLPGLAVPAVLSSKPPKCTTLDAELTPGSRSVCAPFATVITPMLEAGLSAQRVFQDLCAHHGFTQSYSAVKRFVASLKPSLPQRVFRIECEPGQELQIDFAMGPMVPTGVASKMQRTWVFRAILSHSRKGYAEAVLRQDSESLLRVLENALRALGGVPTLLNLDNMRAAVKKPDWFDPELTPKFAAFCRHYGMTPMPCRPYTPEHKGKVERSIQYLKDNALRGLKFASVNALNQHLRTWEQTVADTRIHGTTRQQVGAVFLAHERPVLRALPVELFPAYQEARRVVGRDGFVEVGKAYYEAPSEHIGRSLWVHWDSRTVRLLNDRLELIITHTRLEPGRFTKTRGVRGLDEGGSIQQTAEYLLKRARALGVAAGQWAQLSLDTRGAEAIRSVRGLCQLVRNYTAVQIDHCCASALAAKSGAPRLSVVTAMLKERAKAQHSPALQQSLLPFGESHPLIRDLSTYSQFVDNAQTHNPTPIEHELHCHHQDPSTSTAA